MLFGFDTDSIGEPSARLADPSSGPATTAQGWGVSVIESGESPVIVTSRGDVLHAQPDDAWQDQDRQVSEVVEAPNPDWNCEPSSSCKVTFPASDDYGLAGIRVVSVTQNVPCPVPGLCYQTGNHGLDIVVLDLFAGSSGMNHAQVSQESVNLSLILTNGGRPEEDSITCDSRLRDALCGLGPKGPTQRLLPSSDLMCRTGKTGHRCTSGTAAA